MYDNSGTNAAAIWHSVKEITVNTEIVGVAHVGTHILGGTLGGTDAAVVIAGTDGGTIRALAVNADGEVGIHDGGNSITIDGTVTANIGTIAGVATETTLASVLTELQGITYLEDVASVGGEGLVLAGAVRQDTLAGNTSTDGDYTYLKVDSDGALYIVPKGLVTVGGTVLVGGTVAVSDDGSSLTVDGTVTVIDGGGSLSIDDGSSSITVDGTITANQGGSWTVTAIDGGASLSIDDGGGIITVDGTVDTELTTADLDTGAGTDTRAVVGLVYAASGGAVLVSQANPYPVLIGDGTRTATVRDTGSSDSLNVAIVDASGNQITSFGGGTQYTEGTTQASIVGTAILWEDTSDVVRAVSAAKPLPVNVVSGPAGGTSATDDGAFTPASGSGTPAMGFCDEAATDSVDEGDVGVLRMTADRKLLVRVVGATDANRLDIDSSGRPTVNVNGTVTVDTELPAAAALADNTSNPTVPGVGAFLMAWDGSTWDRAKGDSTDGFLVNLGANNDVTVTGSVTANAGTNLNTSALALESGGNLATIAGAIKAEDAAHASGHSGIMALAVRNDAGTAFAADGDYVPLSTDSVGSLRVAIISGAGSGGTSATDDAAFSVGSGSGTPMMGLADETTPDSVNEGDVGVVRMTLDRKLHVMPAIPNSDPVDDATSVTTSATALSTNNATRRKMWIQNLGSVDVFIGGASVTTSSGFKLFAGGGSATIDELGPSATVYGIVGTGTADVRTLEFPL